MRHTQRIVAIALAIGLGAAWLCSCASAQPPAQPAAEPPMKLTGTIRAVQAEAGTCDLLTGVGHAIRLHRIGLPSGLMIKTRSGRTPATALIPGSVVRIECGGPPEHSVATKVELLVPPPAGKR